MKAVYPVILEQDKNFIVVYVPDFDINTQGNDYLEAIEMARDAIALVGISKEDNKEPLPKSSEAKSIMLNEGQMLTLVDVDFADYRKKNDLKTVKKNCTLPSWLCYEAEKKGINFSAVLQEALKERRLGRGMENIETIFNTIPRYPRG